MVRVRHHQVWWCPLNKWTHPRCRLFLVLHTPQYAPLQCPWRAESLPIMCFGGCLPVISSSPAVALCWGCLPVVSSSPAVESFSTWICCRGTLSPASFPLFVTLPLDLCTLHKCDQTLNVCFHSSTPQGLGASVKQKGFCLSEGIRPLAVSRRPQQSVWCSLHLCFTLGI